MAERLAVGQESKFSSKVKAQTQEQPEAVDSNCDAIDPENYKCVAKRVSYSSGMHPRFFIKRLTRGHPRFFNPVDDEIYQLDSIHTDKGRARWEFSAVSEEAYDLYIQFLRTQNTQLLRNAERA